jgi:hypothetical protein
MRFLIRDRASSRHSMPVTAVRALEHLAIVGQAGTLICPWNASAACAHSRAAYDRSSDPRSAPAFPTCA